jgi:hypothetical protein
VGSRWILAALVAASVTACGAARDPNAPEFPVPPPPPPDPVARAMPAPVMSRYQQTVAPPVSAPPKRDSITEPPPGLPLPKGDDETVVRQSPAEPRPPLPSDTLPDEVILRLLENRRQLFVRCFKKAIDENPIELSFKVKLRVELDANGVVTKTSTDATSKTLDACLVRAAVLEFPATGKPIVVEMPLIYQGP